MKNTIKKSTTKTSKKTTVKNEPVVVPQTIASYIGRVRVLLKSGKTPSEISATMKKPLKDVREWIKLAKAVEKRNERIRKLRKKGTTIKDIAAAEGVSPTTVRRAIKEV